MQLNCIPETRTRHAGMLDFPAKALHVVTPAYAGDQAVLYELPPSYLPPQAGEGDTGFHRNDEVATFTGLTTRCP